MDADTAMQWRAQGFNLGFVISENDPIVCVDVDDCLVTAGGAARWSDFAQNIVNRLPGACIEVSHSGRGLHLWCQGNLPTGHRAKATMGTDKLEMYSRLRFVALGTNQTGTGHVDHTGALVALIAEYMPGDANGPDGFEWTDGPLPEWNGPTDDDVLLRMAINAKQSPEAAFAGKATFRELWEGDTEALIRSYPPRSDSQVYGYSEADSALAMRLAWWTGRTVTAFTALCTGAG